MSLEQKKAKLDLLKEKSDCLCRQIEKQKVVIKALEEKIVSGTLHLFMDYTEKETDYHQQLEFPILFEDSAISALCAIAKKQLEQLEIELSGILTTLNFSDVKMRLLSEAEIADGCNKAYLEAGHNAYFSNGFHAGVTFASTKLCKGAQDE